MMLAHITGHEAPVISAAVVVAFLLGMVFGGLVVNSIRVWLGRRKER